MNPADYAAVESLRDGRPLEIRALRRTERQGMSEFIARTSDETRYRRFFSPKRTFSEREIEYFLNVDFVRHVALVAEVAEEGRKLIAGAGRYIVEEPGRAELAFTVDDSHQNLGIATLLLRHLVIVARSAGIRELVAQVLPDNAPMLKVFERSGLAMATRHAGGVVHVALDLSSGPGSAAAS